ncbi:uncharacterized protein LOC111072691 [Drosophila obscura]|uniref:uncharacterized protein LOC111072691 n=1 Tax=Drosophila obscura TaxID=7282 RepID=UPI001BB1D1C3|nr:uncharacterized protein LOC111072691 [Drosophila obscura]
MNLLKTLVILAILCSCLGQTMNSNRKKTKTTPTDDDTSSSYPPFTNQPTEPEPVYAPDISDEEVAGIVQEICTVRTYSCFMGIVAGLRMACLEFLEALNECETPLYRINSTMRQEIKEKKGKWAKIKKIVWEMIKSSKAIDACDTPFGFIPYPDCLEELVPQLSHLVNAVKSVIPTAVLAVFGEEPPCIKNVFYKVICMALLLPGQIFYCTIKAMFGQ